MSSHRAISGPGETASPLTKSETQRATSRAHTTERVTLNVPPLAYITTGYPYPSQTFIQREVEELRRLGIRIDTHSVRAARDDEILSQKDREEARTTYAIRPFRLADVGRAYAMLLTRRMPQGIRVLSFAIRRAAGFRSLVRQLAYFAQAVILWDQVRARNVRHLHAHFANVSSDLALLAAKIGGEDWSWSFTMHGPTEFADVKHFRLAEKTAAASFVVCISDFCRSQLMALVPQTEWEKLDMVHCAVDVDHFRPCAAVIGHPVNLLCVARLAPVKGHMVLLRALSTLRERGLEVRTILVGDGPLSDEIQQAVRTLGLERSVDLVGSVGQDDIRGYLDSADIFVLPSFSEGLPVVLMEAMASSIPVVATRIAGTPELVEEGVSGLLVTPGRSDELADTIAALVEDPVRRRRLGDAGRQKVQRDFEAKSAAKALAAVFESRLTGAGAPAAPEPSAQAGSAESALHQMGFSADRAP